MTIVSMVKITNHIYFFDKTQPTNKLKICHIFWSCCRILPSEIVGKNIIWLFQIEKFIKDVFLLTWNSCMIELFSICKLCYILLSLIKDIFYRLKQCCSPIWRGAVVLLLRCYFMFLQKIPVLMMHKQFPLGILHEFYEFCILNCSMGYIESTKNDKIWIK